MASTAPPLPAPPPGLPPRTIKFIFKDGRTIVCIDLDGTLINFGWRLLNREIVWGYAVNQELLAFLKLLKKTAEAQGHPIDFYVFSARGRAETVTHLMGYYQYYTKDLKLPHEAAIKGLVTIEEVLAELKKILGIDIPMATVWDPPEKIGHFYLETLKPLEARFQAFITAHNPKSAKNAWDLAEYNAWVSHLNIQRLADMEVAGRRCRSKASMLRDIHTEVIKNAGGLSVGITANSISTIWFDDWTETIDLTLKDLQSIAKDICSRLVVCHIDNESRGDQHSHLPLLLEDLFLQLQLRLHREPIPRDFIVKEIQVLLATMPLSDFSFHLDKRRFYPTPATEVRAASSVPAPAAAGAAAMPSTPAPLPPLPVLPHLPPHHLPDLSPRPSEAAITDLRRPDHFKGPELAAVAPHLRHAAAPRPPGIALTPLYSSASGGASGGAGSSRASGGAGSSGASSAVAFYLPAATPTGPKFTLPPQSRPPRGPRV